MKKIVLFSLIMACVPFGVMAQNANDDLYFIPKKKKEKQEKVTPVTKVETKQVTTVYAAPASSVVVKDVSGNVRDVDEYNRRYTSRDNTFSYDNDTLYIEEKPYNERGEWVNGFEGSQSDYDYAMRIIRFRNPRFAVSVSSPYYWDIVSLGYSWDWNVFDDGMYVYAFPTYSNRFWWNWRYSRISWHSSWYYNSWFGWDYPYHRPFHPYHHHFHHPYHPHFHHHGPMYAGVGGYWGKNHGWNGSSARNPGIHTGRYAVGHKNQHVARRESTATKVSTSQNNRNRNVASQQVRTSQRGRYRTESNVVRNSSGRVVTAKDASTSVRPQRSVAGRNNGETVKKETSTVRSNSQYTRQGQGRSSSYNRSSSTRSTVTNSNTYQRSSNNSSYQSGTSSRRSGGSNASYNSSSSSRSSHSSSVGGGRSGSGGNAGRSNGGGRR